MPITAGDMRPLLLVLCLLACAGTARAAAPVATGLPGIGGTARQGQTLTSTTGTFTGTAPLTYGRTWQRCDTAGADCAPIVGAASTTYVPTLLDVGRTLRVTVAATNLEGTASATSAATPLVAPPSPPVADPAGPPAISGTARDGQALTAVDGTWSGISPLTFTRQWQRCDAGGAACSPLGTAATHTLTSADVGATIRVAITARNADGQAVATSGATAVIDAAPPVNTVPPVLTGTARDGQTLSSPGPGTWTGTIPMTHTRQWLRCDAGGAACLPIDGAIAASRQLTAEDVGATLRLAVTATNARASATATTAASAVVTAKAPPSGGIPAITGSTVDGRTLTASDGTWSGTPAIATTRRWMRCDPSGAACTDLAGVAATLVLGPADTGSTLRVRVTATNADGTGQATSAATPVVTAAPPVSTAAPTIAGTPREGQVLTAATGTWTGTAPVAHAYAWERCAPACAAIPAADASTLRLTPADVGATIRVAVTATNAGGGATARSTQTAAVTGGPPVPTQPPGIAAALPRDGELFTGTLGTWVGTVPLVHDRQWLRCGATGASCTPLPGEVGGTYRAGAADIGRTLRLEVTATNAYGAQKAQSAPSPVVLAAPPQPDGLPVVGGELRDGATLTATSAWTGTAPITLSHQWQRCDAQLPACTDIAAATAATYVTGSGDVGMRIRVRVGALNAGGGGTATSALADPGTGLVTPEPPRATAPPAVTGTTAEGSTLTSTEGTFSGTQPQTRTIRWQRCDTAGAACADIPGATGAERVLAAEDRGRTLRSVVTAVNGQGTDSAASAPTPVVAAAAPRNVVPPSVTPDTGLREGATLVSTPGGWTDSEPMTLAYRWQRCSAPQACTDIPGAGGPEHMLTAADTGWTLRLVVTAANGVGSTAQASALTGVVGANPPVLVDAPQLSGIAIDGDTLTTTDGTWSGPVVVTTAYEWWRCDALGANCSPVLGATASSITLTPADVGLTLRSRVTRTGGGGSTTVLSAPSERVLAAAPDVLALPAVTGPPGVGRTLTADPGTWRGTPAIAHAYRWRRCDDTCTDIPGATAATYVPTAADGHRTLRVEVTATNAVGSAVAAAAATPEIQTDPPTRVRGPALAGTATIGSVLTADPGEWTGAAPIALTWTWRRCDAALTTCTPIAGAAAATHTLVAADRGMRIVARLAAANVVGDATADTDPSAAVMAATVVKPPATTTTAPKPTTSTTTTRPSATTVATRPATTTPAKTAAASPAGTEAAAAAEAAKARRAVATVAQLRLLPGGRLRIVLRCAPKASRACSAKGTVIAGTTLGRLVEGTTLRFALPAGKIGRGRTLRREFPLGAGHRRELRRMRDVNFRVRLEIAGRRGRTDEVFVRARVPKALRG